MKKNAIWSCVVAVAASAALPVRSQQVAALPAVVLAPMGGTAAAQVTRLEAAKAMPYRAGFSRDGDEVVCTVTTNASGVCGAGWFLPLKQREAVAVRISIESRVEAGDGSGEVQLYVDVSYVDGDHLSGLCVVPKSGNPTSGYDYYDWNAHATWPEGSLEPQCF